MTYLKRPPLSLKEILLILAIATVAVVIVGALIAANVRWSAQVPGGGSFFSVWAGARALLFQGADPYGTNSAIRAQQLTNSNDVQGGIDRFRLSLPFFLLPIFFPLASVPDPYIARGLWASIGQAALVITIFTTLRVLEWHPPRPFVVAFSVLAVFSWPAVLALLDGTPAVLLTLAYVGILWAMVTGRDELAGALAVLCLFLWEVGLPFLILVAWRTFHEKRWRIVAGFCMTLVLLLAVSFLLDPGWPLAYLTASTAYFRSPHGISTAAVLNGLSPEFGARIATGLTVLVLGTLVFEWAVGRNSDLRRFVWTGCLFLAATPLIGIGTELSHLVTVVPGFVLVSAAVLQRRRLATWLGILLIGAAFVGPWLLERRWFELGDQRAHDMLFLLLPAICVIGMYWTRWWFLRPARTWLDEVRASKKQADAKAR